MNIYSSLRFVSPELGAGDNVLYKRLLPLNVSDDVIAMSRRQSFFHHAVCLRFLAMQSQIIPKSQFVLDIRVSLLTHMYLMRTRAVGVFAEIEAARDAGNRIVEAFPARSVAKRPHWGAEHLN